MVFSFSLSVFSLKGVKNYVIKHVAIILPKDKGNLK
jgi:hypothetical protein